MTGMLMKISLVFVNMLQSQALRSIKPKAVVALNGKPLNFTCDYQPGMQSHAKYFCRVEEDLCSAQTVWADKHDTVVTAGRYSLYDNTSGAFVSVGLDIVLLEDSGLYWCGVDICERADYITPILLTVVQGGAAHTLTKMQRLRHPRLSNMILLPLNVTRRMDFHKLLRRRTAIPWR
ncbi:CMRF35-like molecule 8 isoform X2 [Synchiropus splendidus]|uniref:CMRF35-like molecule 8 isoform X2 n=1 Tax=Synchiropus splendidus TaxID=270530 RepID=UPI00237D838A|nr:CMRF35-like molecule 8 isoform X2 [Synchiropus splendidus]